MTPRDKIQAKINEYRIERDNLLAVEDTISVSFSGSIRESIRRLNALIEELEKVLSTIKDE